MCIFIYRYLLVWWVSPSCLGKTSSLFVYLEDHPIVSLFAAQKPCAWIIPCRT